MCRQLEELFSLPLFDLPDRDLLIGYEASRFHEKMNMLIFNCIVESNPNRSQIAVE